MSIEFSVGIIAAAFVILVAFLVFVLVRMQTTLKQVDKAVSEGQRLLKTTNEITADIKEKIHGVNMLFRPLSKWNKPGKGKGKMGNFEKVADVVSYAAEGLELVKRFKGKK